MEDTKETRPSKHNRTENNINSERPWQHSQGLHWSAPDGVLMKEEKDTGPTANQKCLQVITT